MITLKPQHKRRMIFIVILIAGIMLAMALILRALNENINLYFTPTQITTAKVPAHHTMRVGGMVKAKTVHRSSEGLGVRFVLTDFKHEIPVRYKGILPALFREGQGIVVQGKLGDDGVFRASRVLAKHDEKYMPPSITKQKHRGRI